MLNRFTLMATLLIPLVLAARSNAEEVSEIPGSLPGHLSSILGRHFSKPPAELAAAQDQRSELLRQGRMWEWAVITQPNRPSKEVLAEYFQTRQHEVLSYFEVDRNSGHKVSTLGFVKLIADEWAELWHDPSSGDKGITYFHIRANIWKQNASGHWDVSGDTVMLESVLFRSVVAPWNM